MSKTLRVPVAEWETCQSCDGRGVIHDCGEDVCPCAEPDEDDLRTCYECGGKGEHNILTPTGSEEE